MRQEPKDNEAAISSQPSAVNGEVIAARGSGIIDNDGSRKGLKAKS
jgi:hypothetical protein